MRLWSFLKEKMMHHPCQTVCESDAEFEYKDLTIWAELFSQKLRGVKCCAILCKSEMAASMALLACFAAGVTALPLSLRYGSQHCNKILDTISPDAIITDENDELSVCRIADSKYMLPKEHPALIMCTSGTTGRPKGVMLSEKNIIANVKDIADYFAMNENDLILIARSLYHCAVLTGEFLTALVKGAKIRFYSESFNPSKMLKMIEDYRITTFCGTPTLLDMMSKLKRQVKTDSLKNICISGECMGKEVGLNISASFPNCDIYHIYGLTEACPRVSYLPPKYFKDYPDCVGIPLKSVSVKILDEKGKEVSVGQDGTLWIKGDNIMLGYYQDKQNTNKVLKDGWLCTGDIAVINNANFLKIKGRNDDLIIKAGMNIYPAEIEAAIKSYTRVREVLVYGIDTRLGMQIGMKISGDFSTVEEVKRLCYECLPAFQIPTQIEIVSELPKNGSGKVIRRVQ